MNFKISAILFCMTLLFATASSQASQTSSSQEKNSQVENIIQGLGFIDEFIGYVSNDQQARFPRDFDRDHRRDDRDHRRDDRDHRRDDRDNRHGHGLYIVGARYGIQGRFCDATWAIAERCDGYQRCRIKAGNHLCGDPMVGVEKDLVIRYRCGRTERRAVVHEYSSITLGCRN